MIPIKINDKKYKIKSISELTTREFIELTKIEDVDMVKYIAWQTKTPMDKAFFAVTSKTVEEAIGKAPDVSKCKLPKWPDYKKTIQTVGQRHQVESCGLIDMELLVFCLAVAQARSNNIDDVEKLRVKYLDMPFMEVLPAGFFFFENYRTGKKSVLKYLKKLLRSIKIPNLKNLRVSKG